MARARMTGREAMRMTFTKGAGKTDALLIERADGSSENLNCPRQGIIPHDMVHYAVEHVMQADGFLARVAQGEALAYRMEARDASEAIERLVETVQAEGWGGAPMAIEDFVALYETACSARGHPALPVSAAQVQAIREEMARVTARWDAVAVGERLVLEL